MKFPALWAFLLIVNSLSAQGPEISFDHKGNRVLKGQISEDSLLNATYYSWYSEGKEAYKPSKRIIRKLAPMKQHLSFVVILGTWCSDTKIHIPALAKINDMLGIPRDSVTLIGVDRQKQTLGDVPHHIQYKSIPVIVVYFDGIEAGRIIETPKRSVEKDIWRILKPLLHKVK